MAHLHSSLHLVLLYTINTCVYGKVVNLSPKILPCNTKLSVAWAVIFHTSAQSHPLNIVSMIQPDIELWPKVCLLNTRDSAASAVNSAAVDFI